MTQHFGHLWTFDFHVGSMAAGCPLHLVQKCRMKVMLPLLTMCACRKVAAPQAPDLEVLAGLIEEYWNSEGPDDRMEPFFCFE